MILILSLPSVSECFTNELEGMDGHKLQSSGANMSLYFQKVMLILAQTSFLPN